MMAQLAVLLPHVQQLSIWIVGVALFCGYWRTQIFRGRWGYPNATVKGVLVLCSIIGVAVSGTGGFSLEGATALLLLAFALKLLEMKTRRDAILVIFLCYFVIATQFLFSQSLPLAIYELTATVLVTSALIGMNQMHAQVRPLRSLRIASLLIGQALPLTVVLFLFFPRVAPLWSMPLPSGAKTGISERMKPGAVAQLTRSDELAFRVAFQSPVPPNSELYFRGLVYTEFTDGTWSIPPSPRLQAGAVSDAVGEGALRYDVLLEPTAQTWLFALDTAFPLSGPVRRNAYHGLEADNAVLSVFRYRVQSWPQQQLEPGELPDDVRQEALAIDRNRNQRLQDQAARWYRAAQEDAARFVERIAAHIRNEPFVYTLSPQTLPDSDSIDAFWFDTRAGFCTHYAGATVMALRSVGIPARMVGGYQGGAINGITGHLEVRQYDAHAWIEYWQRGRGWIRFDPTAAVAPERIQQGLSAALSTADRSQLSLFANARLGQAGAIAGLLEWMDSLEHRWNLWVVGFDDKQQRGLLEALLGELTPRRIGLAMLGGGALSLALVSGVLLLRNRPRPRPPLERAYLQLVATGARAGCERAPDEGPSSFLRRLETQLALGSSGDLPKLGHALEAAFYDPGAAVNQPDLLRRLRRLRLRLSLRRA